MHDIFDSGGTLIGAIPLSQKQRALLDAGSDVEVMFHTPQMLRGALGSDSGKFTLRNANNRIETGEPNILQRYLRLQTGIAAARSP